MDEHETVDRAAVWHRREVAAYWGVGLSTLDEWVAKGHVRLPLPRRDPGGKPYWIAGEVIDGALAREHDLRSPADGSAPAATSEVVVTMTDREMRAALDRL